MKSLSLGKKIFLGFSALLALTLLFGIGSIHSMMSARGKSGHLAEAILPATQVSEAVKSLTQQAAFELRAYGFTRDDAYFRLGMAHMDEADTALEAARSLAVAHDLEALRQGHLAADAALGEYRSLAVETNSLIKQVEANVSRLNEAAGTYEENCLTFLKRQEEGLAANLRERLHKLGLISTIAKAGTLARVTYFKAQKAEDAARMQQAIDALKPVDTLLSELNDITFKAHDLESLTSVESALRRYENAMIAYRDEFAKGAEADAGILAEHQSHMDSSAETFEKSVEGFNASQQEQTGSDNAVWMEKISITNSIIETVNTIQILTWQAEARRDVEAIENAQEQFATITAGFEKLRGLTMDFEELAQIDDSEAAVDNFRKAMVALAGNWKTLHALQNRRELASENALQAASEVAELGLQEANDETAEMAATLAATSRIQIGGLVFAIVAGGVLAFSIGRSITAPVNRVIRALSRSSEQSSAAVGQITASSQTLAQGSSEQAASLEETTASLEEMTGMTQGNSDNASAAKDLSEQTRKAAESGADRMRNLSSAMSKIQKSSENISSIIQTIDAIAFQTNILALNAAVEAARAGEAGAGFAVVAEEVRNLAQRSAQAAKDTAGMIEESRSSSKEGSLISEEVAQALAEIVEKAALTDQRITEIDRASDEQLSGIKQINHAVIEMDKSTQSNAAVAEETASSTDELKRQSEELKRAVMDLTRLVEGGGARHRQSLAVPTHGLAAPTAGNHLHAFRNSGSNGHHEHHEPTQGFFETAAKDGFDPEHASNGNANGREHSNGPSLFS